MSIELSWKKSGVVTCCGDSAEVGDIESDENHGIAMFGLNLLQLSGRRGISGSGDYFLSALCKILCLFSGVRGMGAGLV